MKTRLLALLTVVLTFAGCKEGLDKSPIKLTPGENPNQIAYADQTATTDNGFAFYSNDIWKAEVTETTPTKAGGKNNVWWLKLTISGQEKYSGTAGDFTMAVVLEPNFTGSDRSAKMVLTSAGKSISVFVTQLGTTVSNVVPTDPYPVETITINKTASSIRQGKSETLVAMVYPDNATIGSVSWTSSNTAIATVDPKTGYVTAVSPGSAIITATSNAYPSVSASCTISVMEATAQTGIGTFTYNLAAKPLNVYYILCYLYDDGTNTRYNVNFYDADMEAVNFSFKIDAKNSHTELAEGTYTFDRDGGADTFYQQMGVIDAMPYYCESGTLTITKDDDIYTIDIDLDTYLEPTGSLGPGKVTGRYTGTILYIGN